MFLDARRCHGITCTAGGPASAKRVPKYTLRTTRISRRTSSPGPHRQTDDEALLSRIPEDVPAESETGGAYGWMEATVIQPIYYQHGATGPQHERRAVDLRAGPEKVR